LNRPKELVALLEKGLKAVPEDQSHALLRALANASSRRGLYRPAIETGERWFRTLGPRPPAGDAVKFWLGTGIHAKNLGDLRDARRRFEACLKASVGDP